MYKRFVKICAILLSCVQMLGCKYVGDNDKVETDMQFGVKKTEEIDLFLDDQVADIFGTQIGNLSEKIYIYQDKLYIDYAGDTVARLVFGKQENKIAFLERLEFPFPWDLKTVGTDHYLISGDKMNQILWINDINKGYSEHTQVKADHTISCWDVKNGKVYYSVKTQKIDTEIKNQLIIRDLEGGNEQSITLDNKIDTIHLISVNDKGDIGFFYSNVDFGEDHIGLFCNGHFTEIDTCNVEIWNLGRNQLYEFQLLDNKFMLCTEDIGHTLIPWNRSYEILFDGSWKDIPFERGDKKVLGYVDEFYYVNSSYLVYWSPWTMSGGFGADTIANAKVLLCTLDGKCYTEWDIPETNLLNSSVYFLNSDESIYVISVSGEEEYKIYVQEMPLQQEEHMQN